MLSRPPFCPGPHPFPHLGNIKDDLENTPHLGKAGKGNYWSKYQIQNRTRSKLFYITMQNRNKLLKLETYFSKIFTKLRMRYSKLFYPSRYNYYKSP